MRAARRAGTTDPKLTPARRHAAQAWCEIAKALEAPAVQARFAQLGVQPMPGSRAEFVKFFRDDVAATVALARAAKIPTQ